MDAGQKVSQDLIHHHIKSHFSYASGPDSGVLCTTSTYYFPKDPFPGQANVIRLAAKTKKAADTFTAEYEVAPLLFH